MRIRSFAWLMLLGAAALAGCRNADFEKMLDADSQQRLENMDGDARVLVSLGGDEQAPQVADLAAGDRVLDRSDHGVLLDVARSSLSQLAGTPGLKSGVIWGPGTATAKLDPGLRAQLLAALTQPGGEGPMPIIARFAPGTENLADAIAACGGRARSTTAGIVTLDAPPQAVLRILALPGLVELKKPSTLRPLGSEGE
jgi:hypothetical protein